MAAITHKNITGLDVRWVCEYWDRDEMKRESWDTNWMHMMRDGGFTWSSRPVDPYKFVYEGLDQIKT